MRIDLPSGGWVQWRDRPVSWGERKPLMKMYAEARSGGRDPVDVDEEMLALLIESWSFDVPVPAADPASLDSLPAPDVDTLVVEAQKALDRIFVVSDPTPDPASPTEPSSASAQPSEEGLLTTSPSS